MRQVEQAVRALDRAEVTGDATDVDAPRRTRAQVRLEPGVLGDDAEPAAGAGWRAGYVS